MALLDSGGGGDAPDTDTDTDPEPDGRRGMREMANRIRELAGPFASSLQPDPEPDPEPDRSSQTNARPTTGTPGGQTTTSDDQQDGDQRPTREQPEQGIEESGATESVEQQAQQLEQQVLERNPELTEEDVSVSLVGTEEGARLQAELTEGARGRAQGRFQQALSGIGFEGVGTGEVRAPTAADKPTGREQDAISEFQQALEGIGAFDEGAERRQEEIEGAETTRAARLSGAMSASSARANRVGTINGQGETRLDAAIEEFEETTGLDLIPGEGDVIQAIEADLIQAAEAHRQGQGLLPTKQEARQIGTEAGQLGPFSPSPEFSRGPLSAIAINPAQLALDLGRVGEGVGEFAFDVGQAGFTTGEGRQDALERVEQDILTGLLAGEAAIEATTESFEQRPIETTGTAFTLGLAELGAGVAAGRAIERGGAIARAARADRVVDFEDVTDPATAAGETRLPLFSDEAMRADEAALREFEERMLAGAFDEADAFHGSPGDVGTQRRFTTQPGEAELTGMFVSADASPLRLPAPGTASAPSAGTSFRLPRLRSPATLARFEDLEVDILGERTLAEGRELLEEQAGEGTGFIRSGTRTSEQEAIIPPGTQFAAEGDDFAVRIGGQTVSGRTFRAVDEDIAEDFARIADDVDADPDAADDLARAADEGEDLLSTEEVQAIADDIAEVSRRLEAEGEAFLPGVGATAATTGATSGERTTTTGLTETDTPGLSRPGTTPSRPSGPTSGPTFPPSDPTAPPTTAPPVSEPPTAPPSEPPTLGPPTLGPPTSSPPSSPPSEPPGLAPPTSAPPTSGSPDDGPPPGFGPPPRGESEPKEPLDEAMELWWETAKGFDSGIADLDDLGDSILGDAESAEAEMLDDFGVGDETSIIEGLEAIERDAIPETPGRLTDVGARATTTGGASPSIDPAEAERELVESFERDSVERDLLDRFDL